MSFWRVMAIVWLGMALVVGYDYVQELELMRFFEFSFLLLQGLIAWRISKREDQQKD